MLYVLIIRFHARIHGRFWNQKLQKRKLYVLNCVCVCVLYSIQLLYLKKNKNEAPSLVTTLGPAAEYEPKCVQFGSISLVSLIGDRWMLFMHKLRCTWIHPPILGQLIGLLYVSARAFGLTEPN